jgi:hypothetical protein
MSEQLQKSLSCGANSPLDILFHLHITRITVKNVTNGHFIVQFADLHLKCGSK